MKIYRFLFLCLIGLGLPTSIIWAIETTTLSVKRAHDVATLSFVLLQGGQDTHTLTSSGNSNEVSKLAYGLNSINQSYIKSNFKGYSGGIASLSSVNNNVYYFALASVPTVENGFTFYRTASVTDDADFDANHYVHYFDADGNILIAEDRDNAVLKVAYDKSRMAFVVKTNETCPEGDFTLYFGMVRRYKASGTASNTFSYSAYFTLHITVESATQVDEPVVSDTSTSVAYDLAGRKLSTLRKGFYIIDGKKRFVR